MDKKDRLLSLDAFRGFDMMWLMGGLLFLYKKNVFLKV